MSKSIFGSEDLGELIATMAVRDGVSEPEFLHRLAETVNATGMKALAAGMPGAEIERQSRIAKAAAKAHWNRLGGGKPQ